MTRPVTIEGDIESMYRHKIGLLEDLLDCLAKEMENLVDVNIHALWGLMEDKKRLLHSIQSAENRIQTLESGKALPAGRIPKEGIAQLRREINDLKGEIGARVRENVTFIQETLGFFDELISLIVKGGQAAPVYGPMDGSKGASLNPVYYREV